MSDKNNEQDAAIFDQSFWDELKKLEEGDEWSAIAELSKQALMRPTTSLELDYLLRRYAYLELSDALVYEPVLVDVAKVQFIKSRSNWLIHDHGSILRASPGKMLYHQHNAFIEPIKLEEQKGYGTIVQQYVDTALDMLVIAKNRWQGAKVLSGYRPMQFAAYLIAQASNYILEGVELTKEEMQTYQYVKERIVPIPIESPELDRMPR